MLHVAGEIHPYTMGGIGVHVHDLCKDLTKLNQQITVYTTLPRYPQEINLGFEVVDFHRYITIAGNIIALNMIPSLFKNRYSFDVIHAHSHLFFSTVLCACMRKMGSSPLIITNHGFQSQSAPKWLQKIYLPTVAKWTLNSADKILCYTNSAKQELIDAGIKAEKIAIIPIGVDTDYFHPYPKTNPENKVFSILWAARLVPIKGLKYMIKAFEKFHEKYPDSELKILGEGIYYNDLVKYVQDTKQEEAIHILGKIDFKNLPQAYSDADVFCMTSSYEAGPKTIFEAMACGCPVISNDLDHLKNIVPNGGYLVSVKDTDKFVNLLEYCYINREILSELGVAGNHYISSHHTWERLVLDNLHISEEVRCNKNRLE